jgi:hypothetical protein
MAVVFVPEKCFILTGRREVVKHGILNMWNLILDYDIDSVVFPGQNK